jgi:hypothetical protein
MLASIPDRLGTSKCIEILKEEVGFRFTISVFEAFTTSSPNYIAVGVRGSGLATSFNFCFVFEVNSINIEID